jgi:hypothetical protein
MEVATALQRPAVEAISDVMVAEFGREIDSCSPTIKQMIGDMVREIMVANGYRVDMQDVRISQTNLFKIGIRYAREGTVGRQTRLIERVSRDCYLKSCARLDAFTRAIDQRVYNEHDDIIRSEVIRLAAEHAIECPSHIPDDELKLRVTSAIREKLKGDASLICK